MRRRFSTARGPDGKSLAGAFTDAMEPPSGGEREILPKQSPLLNSDRLKLFEIVCNSPGVTFSQLKRYLGWNSRRLVWHIRVLEKNEIISSFHAGSKGNRWSIVGLSDDFSEQTIPLLDRDNLALASAVNRGGGITLDELWQLLNMEEKNQSLYPDKVNEDVAHALARGIAGHTGEAGKTQTQTKTGQTVPGSIPENPPMILAGKMGKIALRSRLNILQKIGMVSAVQDGRFVRYFPGDGVTQSRQRLASFHAAIVKRAMLVLKKNGFEPVISWKSGFSHALEITVLRKKRVLVIRPFERF